MTNRAIPALELLGLPPTAKVLLIVSDGLGSSNAANLGVYRSLRDGLATTAGLQVPCPWARSAVSEYQGEDVGVSLTVNSQHDGYRWGPITHAPSLLDGDGGFPRTPADFWDHADVDETRRECRAQIERAVLWGFDVSHLSAHLDALCARPEFFDVFLELATEFRLPISLPDPTVDLGFPARELAADEGVVVPDRVLTVPQPEAARAAATTMLSEVEPGVTELHVEPAADTPELRAITASWAARVDDAELVSGESPLRRTLNGVELIGYRRLREAQRRARPSHAS